MNSRKISLLFMVIFGFSTICYATDEENSVDARDDRLFPKMTESKLFQGIPVFDPQKDMSYLSVESQGSIRSIAEHFSVLRDYLAKQIAKRSWVIDSISSSSSISPTQTGQGPQLKMRGIDHNLWIDQLTDLQNACCFFLADKTYGFFSETFKEVSDQLNFDKVLFIPLKFAEGIKYIPQKSTLIKIYQATDEEFTCRLIIFTAVNSKGLLLLENMLLPAPTDGFYKSQFEEYEKQYEKKKASKEKISFMRLAPGKLKAGLDSLTTRQEQFNLLGKAIQINRNNQTKGIIGVELPISIIAQKIGLVPELFTQFKEMRLKRIFDYRMPPAGPIQLTDIRSEAIGSMEEELKIADVLMSLEKEFNEAFKEISKDKVMFWLKEALVTT